MFSPIGLLQANQRLKRGLEKKGPCRRFELIRNSAQSAFPRSAGLTLLRVNFALVQKCGLRTILQGLRRETYLSPLKSILLAVHTSLAKIVRRKDYVLSSAHSPAQQWPNSQ